MFALPVLCVVAILILAFGVMALSLNSYRGKMIAALAGRSVVAVSLSDVRRVPVGRKHRDSSVNLRRFSQIAANDGAPDLAFAA